MRADEREAGSLDGIDRIEPEVIRRNRLLLGLIGLDAYAYATSRSRYGCPPRLRAALDRPINEEINCTDLLVSAAHRLRPPCSFLEIGVSIGRNLWVLANTLHDSLIVGLDWERINPALERRLERVGGRNGCLEYRYGSNRLRYVRGDVLDETAWRALRGEKFNLVFSDAVHRPEALAHEFRMLQSLDLIARRFVMLWDDLDGAADGPMTLAFRSIAQELASHFRVQAGGDRLAPPQTRAYRLQVNGWLGEHEHKHHVGVVSALGTGPG